MLRRSPRSREGQGTCFPEISDSALGRYGPSPGSIYISQPAVHLGDDRRCGNRAVPSISSISSSFNSEKAAAFRLFPSPRFSGVNSVSNSQLRSLGSLVPLPGLTCFLTKKTEKSSPCCRLTNIRQGDRLVAVNRVKEEKT